ncbi:hypothetical protein WDU94_000383 [Cyamophila willieti]
MAALATSVVMMDRGNNTTCTINLHGATVVSWRVNNQEQLFVRQTYRLTDRQTHEPLSQTNFSAQFGAWAFGPQHGFARNITWTLEKAPEKLQSGDVEVIFSLMDNEYTRCMWNYPFRLTYRLILREKELHFNIGVYNPSVDLAFNFNLLLHTYLKVPDVRRCTVNGLYGCHYIDKNTYLKVPDVRRCTVNGLYGCHYIDKVLDGQLFRESRVRQSTYLRSRIESIRTLVRNTSLPVWCPGGKCDSRNTTFPTQVPM